MFKRCLSQFKVLTILETCPNSACGGHFLGQFIGQKSSSVRYFWPTLFKDSHNYVNRCDACQKYARNDLRMEISLYMSLFLVPFEKWGLTMSKKSTPIHPREWLTFWLPPSTSPSGRRPKRSRLSWQNMRLH